MRSRPVWGSPPTSRPSRQLARPAAAPTATLTRSATGKVWLITGANSGFGQAITRAALGAGDIVVAAVRRPESLDELAAANPGRVVPVALDVTDPARITAVVAEVILWYGRIHVLVNNAGRGQVPCRGSTTAVRATMR